MAVTDEFWVFGYGSLIWRPGFEYLGKQRARVYGYHRALCLASHVHRGTPQRPGLVLSLDKGGSCIGIAYRIDPAKRAAVTDYLRARELVTSACLEREVSIKLEDGRSVKALKYVMDRSHDQYTGPLTAQEAAQRVVGAIGISGPNEEYVFHAVEHLNDLGIRDPWLDKVAAFISRE